MTASFLVKKSASTSFFYRAIIPLDLRDELGAREFLVSLETGLLKEAKRIALRLRAFLEEQLEQVRQGQALSLQALKEAIKKKRDKILFEVSVRKKPTSTTKSCPELDTLLEERGISLHQSSNTYQSLAMAWGEVVRSGGLAARLLWELLKSEAACGLSAEPLAPAELRQPPRHKETLTSQVMEEFMAEMQRTGTWREKTTQEYQAKLALFVRIVGDLPIQQHNFETGRSYKQTLLKLPANLNKHPELRGKNLDEIVETNPKPMSPQTVNNHLRCVGAFFEWAMRNGFVQQNYLSGFKVKVGIRAQEQRQIFTDADLKAIFQPETLQKATQAHEERYWIPLIALHTGMRINEIAQMHLDDVKSVDEIWVFDINENAPDKKLKNASSQRLVPIHPKLVELGFLDYHTRLQKARRQRLFPNLKQERDGYARGVSRWFNDRYLPSLGIKEPGKCFHSFRHTVADKLKQQNVDYSLTAELLGHSIPGETHGRYGKRFNASLMLERAVKKLTF